MSHNTYTLRGKTTGEKRAMFAKFLFGVKAQALDALSQGNIEGGIALLEVFNKAKKERGNWFDYKPQYVEGGEFVGSGNKALRRSGEYRASSGCGCVVCVVYGGDCSYSMSIESYNEWHSEWHKERRGKKTKLSRREPVVFVDTSSLLSVKMGRG